MTSLDDINGRSIQTLLRGENESKQSDEFQAIMRLYAVKVAYFKIAVDVTMMKELKFFK